MTQKNLQEIDLERHARLLGKAVAGEHSIAVCDAEGSVVWSRGGSRGLDQLLAELGEQRREVFSGERGCIQLGSGRELLFEGVRDGVGAEVYWLAVVSDGSGFDRDRGSVEKNLCDVAASIGSEYRMHGEVEALARELSERYDELNLVYSLEGQSRALDQGTVGARELLRDFADCLRVDVAVLLMKDRLVYATGPDYAIPNLDLVLTALRGDVMPFVRVSRKPLILNEREDIRREYLFANMPYRVLACPVEHAGGVEAMLVLIRREDSPFFTNGDRNLAMVIAAQTALILRNQQMVSNLKRFGEELAEALIKALEVKDPYTRGHSERVQQVSVKIGGGAGLAASDIEDISWGALLHDVGKIGIPDRILCKTGRLTEEEYTLVKIHPERSYEILRHIEHLGRNALDAARYHQEKFDGTGYPHGLTGRQIPLHARVTAVADTYDAITSSRAYRAGLPHEQAMERIAEAAGTQLDPEYVQIFERICDEDLSWLRVITGPKEPGDG